MSAFEHDDFVLVGAIVKDVAQGQQRWRVGKDRVTPGGIALMGNHQRCLVSRDGRVQHAAERGDRRGTRVNARKSFILERECYRIVSDSSLLILDATVHL